MHYPIHRYRALATLSPDEARTLEELGERPIRWRRGETIRREGERINGIHLMIEGWVSSSMVLRSGKRLIQKVHLPGDMLGTPSMILRSAADTLTAMTESVTAYVSEQRMGALFATSPRLTALFIMAVQAERLALMDALLAVGNGSARERLARLLLDLHARLGAIGLVRDDAFDLPLTQEVLGDLLGLTAVHVNRTLRAMDREGLIAARHHRMTLLDLPALQRLSPVAPREFRFDPDWMPTAEPAPIAS